MPWLRLWTDILDDVSLDELDDRLFRGWTLLLIAAKKFYRNGELPPVKTIAFWIHRTENIVVEWIEDLVAAGMLDRNGVTVFVHGWARWQEPKDRTNASRQSEWRKRNAVTKKQKVPVPPKEKQKQSESRAEQTVTPVTGVTVAVTPHNGVTHAHALSEISTGRKGEEHEIFLKVISELESHEPTKFIAASLVMAADTPGIRNLPSWRLFVAARTIQQPNKSKTWGLFQHVAQTCTEAQYQKCLQASSSNGASKAQVFEIIREGT
jgi:hypothetical protein